MKLVPTAATLFMLVATCAAWADDAIRAELAKVGSKEVAIAYLADDANRWPALPDGIPFKLRPLPGG